MTLFDYVICGAILGFILGSIVGSFLFRRRVWLPTKAAMRRRGPVIRLFNRALSRRSLRNYRRRVPYVYYDSDSNPAQTKRNFN